MYKLFLCLKYLRRRHLALIAVAAIALCVAMVLIVVSVYDGFLSKVEQAAKGLFGDIIIDAPSLSAIERYDEFISQLTGEYRLGGGLKLAGAGADGEVVFQGKTGPADAVALAGEAKFDSPGTFPARGIIFKGGRHVGDVRGQMVLHPGKLNPETEEFEYEVRFSGKTELALSRLADSADPIHLAAVYAKVGDGVAEVESATPVIYTYGLLRIGDSFTTTVQICGIRLPERLAVTDFGDGLFAQAGRADASFDPPLADVFDRTRKHLGLIKDIHRREQARPPDRREPDLQRKLLNGWDNAEKMLGRLGLAMRLGDQLRELRAELAAQQAAPPARRDEAKIAELSQSIQGIAEVLNGLIHPPAQRVILGLGIAGLSFRTPAGDTVRWVSPGKEVKLTLLPLRRGRQATTITPSIGTFTVIDDVKTDVWTVDSTTLYASFDRLQTLADMGARTYADDASQVAPALCSQIQIKVKPAFASGRSLVQARRAVEARWRAFERAHPAETLAETSVQTWRERLAKFIGPVEKQRALVTIMFGIISSVSVLLIFAIFYMIVMQKTRDIGVIRAVGGSAPGVAQIFLAYGAATGLVGSILGLVGGYYFVRYINEVEDLLARWWGFRVWERDVFLFERIPNEVDPAVALVIAVWAVASGLVGALIPAVRAAVMEPAEAVRYE